MDQLSLHAILATPPLSRERELELARSARAGNDEARGDLIRLSLRLVAMRARNLGVPAEDIDDALQAGTVGLIAAVDRFDPDRGVRLSTFAWPWITASIKSSLASTPTPAERTLLPADAQYDLDTFVARLPVRLREVVQLRFRLGEPPDALRTHADVAARLGLTIAQVRWAEAKALGRLRDCLARLGDRDPL